MREAGAGAPAQGRVINLPVRLTWPDCLMWFGGAATVPPTPSYTSAFRGLRPRASAAPTATAAGFALSRPAQLEIADANVVASGCWPKEICDNRGSGVRGRVAIPRAASIRRGIVCCGELIMGIPRTPYGLLHEDLKRYALIVLSVERVLSLASELFPMRFGCRALLLKALLH